MTATLRDCHASEPVWLPKDTLDLHYNGFCNAVLWQLFHYVPVQMDFRLAEAPTLQQEWGAYQAANELFADAVLESYHDGEVVWIQDYHLMLLPNILKQRRPSMKVHPYLTPPASMCADCHTGPSSPRAAQPLNAVCDIPALKATMPRKSTELHLLHSYLLIVLSAGGRTSREVYLRDIFINICICRIAFRLVSNVGPHHSRFPVLTLNRSFCGVSVHIWNGICASQSNRRCLLPLVVPR